MPRVGTKIIVESPLKLLVSDKWELTADSCTYILKRKSAKRYITEGYYHTIEEALNAIMQKQIRESDAQTLSALLKQVKLIRKDIKNIGAEIVQVCQTLDAQ